MLLPCKHRICLLPLAWAAALLNPANSQEPGLHWSTYLGGSDSDNIRSIAQTSLGDWIVAGRTESADFPATAHAWQNSSTGGTDAFVAKISADGKQLLWATYLGGSDDDWCWKVIVDNQDRPILVGNTDSADFPTTPGAYDRSLDAEGGFIARLSADGSILEAATLVDGSSFDECFGIALTPQGNVVVVGATDSFDFPVKGPSAASHSGFGPAEAFVTVFQPDLNDLVISTCYGGPGGDEWPEGVALLPGPNGSIVLYGNTDNPTLPNRAGSVDSTYNGGENDAFLALIDSSTAGVIRSTYFGGSKNDEPRPGLKVDHLGRIVFSATTDSTDFPVSASAVQPTLGGGFDVALVGLAPDLQSTEFSTYLGGTGNERANDLLIDANGLVVAMYSDAPSIPVTDGCWDPVFNDGANANMGDIVIVRLDPSATVIQYSSYFGGTGVEFPLGMASDGPTALMVAGITTSPDFPDRMGGFDRAKSGPDDGFLARIELAPGPILTSTPLHRGTTAALSVTGLTPFAPTYFVYSLHGPGRGPSISSAGMLALDVINPTLIQGVTADGSGNALVNVPIPAQVPLLEVSLQAIMLSGTNGTASQVTQVITSTILP